MVLLVTKKRHCLSKLLVRHAFGGLKINVLSVVSDHKALTTFTHQFGGPFRYLLHEGRSHGAHEAKELAALAAYRPDLMMLAKYMRILSPAFVAPHTDQLVNIQHSFLPAFVGANPCAGAHA